MPQNGGDAPPVSGRCGGASLSTVFVSVRHTCATPASMASAIRQVTGEAVVQSGQGAA